ncbi:DNA-directed RNA polymerase I subunit RPA43 [Ischnura elegans]|uniref:DNA-directed RNA polymerase I subunit RPA43 n=1 Tax=Ischnura elegans TaxID=197161 RepID=UPI001ED89C12|nr:DNA-directed RNA polymerase I subunit RPA43 [Ischnura elegans]
MQDIVDIKFSKSELNTLVKTKGTCVTLEKKTRVVFLLPSQLLDIKSGIKENLDSHLLKYDYETKAIIIGYEKIKILSKYGSICYGYSKIALRIEASFYLFKPSVGSMLQGVVCKQSGRHLGCLVLKGFNVSIPLEDDACGWDFSIGQDIKFTVVKLDLTSGPLPYILGQMNMDGTERAIDTVVRRSPGEVEGGGVVSKTPVKIQVVSRPPEEPQVVSRPPVAVQGDGSPWGQKRDGETKHGGDGGRDSLISQLLKTVEMSLGEEGPQPSKKQKARASVGPQHSPSPQLAKAPRQRKKADNSVEEDSSGSIIDRLLEMSKRELLGVSEETTPRGKKRKAEGSPLVAVKKERVDIESAVKVLSPDVSWGGANVVPSSVSSKTSNRLPQLKVGNEAIGKSNMTSPVSVDSTKSPQKHAKVKRKSLAFKSENFKD